MATWDKNKAADVAQEDPKKAKSKMHPDLSYLLLHTNCTLPECVKYVLTITDAVLKQKDHDHDTKRILDAAHLLIILTKCENMMTT